MITDLYLVNNKKLIKFDCNANAKYRISQLEKTSKVEFFKRISYGSGFELKQLKEYYMKQIEAGVPSKEPAKEPAKKKSNYHTNNRDGLLIYNKNYYAKNKKPTYCKFCDITISCSKNLNKHQMTRRHIYNYVNF